MNETALASEHNVARYCAPRKTVEGIPSYEAFLLRAEEDFLSTNWLEYFDDSERRIQMAGVRRALSEKGFRTSPNGKFALLNVGRSTESAGRVALSFRLLEQPGDPSHCGVFGYLPGDIDIALALAETVNEVHPT